MEDNEKIKINVSAQGDTVRVGADVIELEDDTQGTFHTSDLDSFVKYVEQYDEAAVLYFDERMAALFPDEITHNTEELAICTLEESLHLVELRRNVMREISPVQLDEFLTAFKPVLDTEGIRLLDLVRNFKMEKTLSIENQKLQGGNYAYRCSRDSGKSDVIFPEKIAVIIPIFKFLDDAKTSISFDVFFDYTEPTTGNIKMAFKLKSFTFEDEIQKAKRECLSAHFKPLKCAQHWGSLGIKAASNEWMYKRNSIDG